MGGIRFHALTRVRGIALARSKTATHTDRTDGSITVQLTDQLGQTYSQLTQDTGWCTVGTTSMATPRSNYYEFSAPVFIGALRLRLSSGTTCIDEIEIFT